MFVDMFITLFDERYDLIMPTEALQNPLLQPLLNQVQSGPFRHAINALAGYDSTETGGTINLAGNFSMPVTSITQ